MLNAETTTEIQNKVYDLVCTEIASALAPDVLAKDKLDELVMDIIIDMVENY